MNDLKAIKLEFDKVLTEHNLTKFCHSIDKERYKIYCRDFFLDVKSKKLFLTISGEADFANIESESVYLNWLNREWYDKTWGDIFCRP